MGEVIALGMAGVAVIFTIVWLVRLPKNLKDQARKKDHE